MTALLRKHLPGARRCPGHSPCLRSNSHNPVSSVGPIENSRLQRGKLLTPGLQLDSGRAEIRIQTQLTPNFTNKEDLFVRQERQHFPTSLVKGGYKQGHMAHPGSAGTAGAGGRSEVHGQEARQTEHWAWNPYPRAWLHPVIRGLTSLDVFLNGSS